MIRLLKDLVQKRLPVGIRRSAAWRRVRAEHLAEHPLCEACGGWRRLEVHHVLPVHLDRSLELDPANLLTLCEAKKHGINCHLAIGHNGNYQSFNPNVRRDARAWRAKIS